MDGAHDFDLFSLFISCIKAGGPAGIGDSHLDAISASAARFAWQLMNIRDGRTTTSGVVSSRIVFSISNETATIDDCDLCLVTHPDYSLCLFGINQSAVFEHGLFAGCGRDSLILSITRGLLSDCGYSLGLVGYEVSLLAPNLDSLTAGTCVVVQQSRRPSWTRAASSFLVDAFAVYSGRQFGELAASRSESILALLDELSR